MRAHLPWFCRKPRSTASGVVTLRDVIEDLRMLVRDRIDEADAAQTMVVQLLVDERQDTT